MPSELRTALPSDKVRKVACRALRDKIKRGDQGCWRPKEDRADPVDFIEEAYAGRLERLVPVRVSRMLTSPYAFLRGAASLMADDFACVPGTGIEQVICDGAHLDNLAASHAPMPTKRKPATRRCSWSSSPVDCPPSMELSQEKMRGT